MRIAHFVPLAAVVLIAGAAGAQAPRHHKKAETQAELQKEAKMTMADARTMALKVNIDAMTGKLVAHQHETPKDERAEARADAKAARAAAKAKAKP